MNFRGLTAVQDDGSSFKPPSYFSELRAAMMVLAMEPRTVFLGQAVKCAGTGMSASFAGIAPEKLIELPVFEDCQLGMSIGLSLAGDLPVSVFPRWNFLLLATNQLINHLDKFPKFSDYRPRVIIRVASCSPKPLNPGPQHLGDFGDAFRMMLKTVVVEELGKADQIVPAYMAAREREGSTILVEYPELYNVG